MKALMVLVLAGMLFSFGYWLALDRNKESEILPNEPCAVAKEESIVSKSIPEQTIAKKHLENTLIEIESNKLAITELQQELSATIKMLSKKELELENFLSERDDSKKQPFKIITKEVAESALQKPFSDFFVDATGARAEKFNQFQNEAQDYDWAYIMEIQIKDFMTIHHQAGKIELRTVKCKTTACEITGFESEEQILGVILRDMSKQSWWEFRNTNSYSSQSTEFGQYFYVLLSKE